MTNYVTMWEIIMMSDTSKKDEFIKLYKFVEETSIEHLYSFYEIIKKIIIDTYNQNDIISLITIKKKLMKSKL